MYFSRYHPPIAASISFCPWVSLSRSLKPISNDGPSHHSLCNDFLPNNRTTVARSFPHSPVYGVAPCPTTIFTFGLFLWSEKKLPISLLLETMMWAVVGGSAAVFLGVREDLGLIVSGLISISITLFRSMNFKGLEAKKIGVASTGGL